MTQIERLLELDARMISVKETDDGTGFNEWYDAWEDLREVAVPLAPKLARALQIATAALEDMILMAEKKLCLPATSEYEAYVPREVEKAKLALAAMRKEWE